MSIQNFKSSDPFEGAGSGTGSNAVGLIHIRLQQRNGRKTLTTVQGLSVPKYEKAVLKKWKKEFSCNGTLIEEKDEIIFQLQGNHCDEIKKFLMKHEMATKSQIKVHGWNSEV